MKIKYALIVAFVLTALACGQAPATSPTQDVRTPTPAPLPTSHFAAQRPTPIALPNLKVVELGSEFWPTDLSGDRLVGIGRDGEVYLANVRTGKTRQLTNDGYRKRQPVISGDTVAWTDQSRGVETHDSNSRTARGLADDIFVLDLNTGETRRITEVPAKRSGLKISGKRLVWLDNRNEFGEHYTHRDIYAYDLEADEEIAVAVAAGAQHWVAIEGDRVVWVDNRNSAILGTDRSGCFQCPDNRFDIYLYDFTTGEELVLDDSGANNTMPDIHGDRVVWRDFDEEGRTAIRLLDIDTGERRPLASPSLSGVDWPLISGDYVVWTVGQACDVIEVPPSGVSTGAFAHDLRTGEVKQLSNYVEPSISLDGTVVVIHEACQVGGRAYAVFLGRSANTSESATPASTVTAIGVQANGEATSIASGTTHTPTPTPRESGLKQFTDARPSPDWRIVEAPGWPSQPGFSLQLPPGWELKELQGIDSYVGEVTGDGVRLTFDYGGFSWGLDPSDDPAHTYSVVYEAIDGVEAKLLISMEVGSGYTGVYFANLGGPSLNLVGEGLTPEQQQTAIAVFRSIRLSSREALDNPEDEYSMAHLARWYRALNNVIGQVPGIVFTDLDEGKNRIEIVMQPRRGAREEMEAAIASVDVPRGAVVIDVGCEGVNPWPLDNGNPPGEAFLRAIDYSLEVEDQASYGETVQMKLRLRNVSDDPITFHLGGRPPHDFVVSTPGGEQVWHWMCAKFTLSILEIKTLEPGEEVEFTGEWEQVDNRGEPVPPGTYLVRGVWDMEPPEKLVTEAHELEILR